MPRVTMHTLYRFYDTDGTLLYVGITNNPPRRFAKHRGEKSWWTDVHRIELDQYTTREELRTAERHAIENEKPLHNIRMNGCDPRESHLTWLCDICRAEVADNDGYIFVNYKDIRNYRVGRDEWERQHLSGSAGRLVAVPIEVYSSHPALPRWHVTHITCDPSPDSDAYWFDIEDVRTRTDMLRKSAHLFQTKNWVIDTNWVDVMYRAAA